MADRYLKTSMVVLVAAMLAGCSPSETPETEPVEPAATETPEVVVEVEPEIETEVVSLERSAEDVAKDEARKPDAVLDFMGVEPGDVIVEMEAGGGYFTEILSGAVGGDGVVYMQNPAAFDAMLGDMLATRVEGRLTNVEVVKSNFDDLSAVADDSADYVTWFQGPHELWYTPEGVDTLGDPVTSFAEIARVLKPGGSFVVLDHTAPDGTPASSGGEVHRVDPAIIKDMAETAGLDLVEESDLFDNPEDDLTNNVFDEQIRGKTDQFLLKFSKPE